MPLKRQTASINVITATRLRIINLFSNGLPVYLSFSAGKDSIVLADIICALINKGQIDPSLLTVQFIDEEAIYSCMEKSALHWRKRFMLLGVKFEWFCLEVKHYNCFNSLENDESFICWDRKKEAVWIRQPPPFAIREHDCLRPGMDTYQDFLNRICRKGLIVTGVRMAESVQRLKNMALMHSTGKWISKKNHVFPMSDWKDADIWLYLYEHNLEIPDIYLFLWQSGHNRKQMRVSQFFSIDTARSLVKMNEYYPNLMERILKREPNAYLAALYWDSEMFGRSSQKRRQLEQAASDIDYRKKLIEMFTNPKRYFTTNAKLKIARKYRHLFLKTAPFIMDKDLKDLYEALAKGDPKMRSFRAVFQIIYTHYLDNALAEYRSKEVQNWNN